MLLERRSVFNSAVDPDDMSIGKCCVGSALIIGGGAAASGVAGALGSYFGGKKQQSGIQSGIDAVQQMFGTAKSGLDPYINAGSSALDTLKGLITPGANQTQTLSQIPGFTFAQDWGQKAVQNLGSMRGYGGNVLASGAQYATGLAQQGWQGIVSALQGLVNTGSGAAGSLASAAGTAGGNLLGGNIAKGNSAAGQITGVANSVGNAVGGAANTIGGYNALDSLMQQGMYTNVSKLTGQQPTNLGPQLGYYDPFGNGNA